MHDSVLPWINPSVQFNNSSPFSKYVEYLQDAILP